MKTETKLARVLSDLATTHGKLDSTAGEILTIIKSEGVRGVKRWDDLVRAAYTANGWHPSPGRPNAAAAKDAKGKAKERVPATVRTYVSTVRRAIRAGLVVTKYRSFTALRADLAKRTEPAVAAEPALPRAVRQSFVGVSVAEPRQPNGALFHDLGAVYILLPAEHRDVFKRQLARLLQKYMPLANIEAPTPAAADGEPTETVGKAKRKAA
jgi:hypothetical protein